MQIESICVTNHICGGFEQVSMGRNAETKSLPFLSVVQSTHGSYRIALDDGPALETGEMGVFVAPRARMQAPFTYTGRTGRNHVRTVDFPGCGSQPPLPVGRFVFVPNCFTGKVPSGHIRSAPTHRRNRTAYGSAAGHSPPAVYPTGSSHAHEKRAGGRYPPAELHRKSFFPPDIDS